jgi:hypothetical protein
MDPSNNKLLLIRATLVFYFTYKSYDIDLLFVNFIMS